MVASFKVRIVAKDAEGKEITDPWAVAALVQNWVAGLIDTEGEVFNPEHPDDLVGFLEFTDEQVPGVQVEA